VIIKMRWLALLSLWSVTVLAQQPASLADLPNALVLRMLEGTPQRYQATIVFGTGKQFNTAELNFGANVLQLRRLDGDTARPLQSVNMRQAQVVHELAQQLMQSYNAQWQGHEKIADRDTRRVMFVPKDGWRYRYQLWLDEQTGVALKRELYRQQELIEQMMTTSIQFSAEANPAVRAPTRPAHVAFFVKSLPAGFVQVGDSQTNERAQQIFSDGLANVSVFVQAAGQFPANAHAQRGALGMLVKRIRSVEFVAIGDVPEPTLARFLSDVRPIN
jgi:MucB/RseB N-terminal domain/MucB/RseB C-terminal domain